MRGRSGGRDTNIQSTSCGMYSTGLNFLHSGYFKNSFMLLPVQAIHCYLLLNNITLLIHFPTNEHLRCFQLGTTMDRVAMNILV